MQLSAIIEALLIASEAPLPSAEIARLVRARVAEAEDALVVDREPRNDTEDGHDDDSRQLPEELAAHAKVNESDVAEAIAELNRSYEATGRAFLCSERAKGWKIHTLPDYAAFVRQLFPDRTPARLSAPAMETLAIIAYRQPVTKGSIEAVRGVSCDGMLQKLLDRELIKISGRAELPGRPLLYATTDLFFEHFGVKSVDELPNANELRTVALPEAKEEPLPDSDAKTGGESASDDESSPVVDIEKQLALTSAGLPLADESQEPTTGTNEDDEQPLPQP